MSAQPKHGRRRALPAATPRRRPFFQEPTFRLRGQQFGVTAAVTGMIALTVLSAAQADSAAVAAVQDRPAAVAAPAPEEAVTAAVGAVVSFDSPKVTSQPAPASAPARPAGALNAPAGGPSVPAAAPASPSKGLRAPLASINVSSPFGFRVSPITGAVGELHTGIDLTGACTTAVFAAGTGTVTEAGWSPYGSGNRIVVDHGNGLKTTYNHLASIGVSLGQAVAQGQQIAGVGTTGASTGCHLHFEVMVNGQTVDPSAFI
ncbi:UNVERIFIED_ORG: murein DD-endopeptidase MepM/ murein hydrolase activator NlpD [Arthrobacter sp. UYCu721]